MICAKCEQELPGATVICRHCGYNNALKRYAAQQNPRAMDQTDGAEVPSEATLIPFPVVSSSIQKMNKGSQGESSASGGAPQWRDEIRQKVRQFREQKGTEAEEPENPPDAPPAVLNPILEKALQRLNRPISIGAERTPQKAPLSSQATARQIDDRPAARERSEHHTGGVSPRPAHEQQRFTKPLTSATEFLSESGVEIESSARLITSTRTPQDSSHHAKNGNSQATPGANSPEHNPTVYSPISQAPETASLADRALAAMLDLVLICVAFAPFLTMATTGAIRLSQENGYYTLLGIAIWIAFMYQFWTMLVAGRTCGMAWRQLRVAESSHHEFIFPQWRMFARAIAATAALLFFPINMIFIYLNGHQASLPDIISGTTVVQYSPLRAPGKAS